MLQVGSRPNPLLLAFQQVVDDCCLQDLGFHGNQFTWSNNREEGHVVFERLDRCFNTLNGLIYFPILETIICLALS